MNSDFQETRWSLLQQARRIDAPETRQRAINELCTLYWKPLYWFTRRQGHSPEDAADLVQGFFAALLDRGDFERADRRKGRLRSFLLAMLKGYLSDERKRNRAAKRGGGVMPVSIDTTEGERLLKSLNIDQGGLPDTVYDRIWARLVMDRCLKQLESEFEKKNRSSLFEELKPHLFARGEGMDSVADRLDMSEGTVRVTLHRMRGRMRELLREEREGTTHKRRKQMSCCTYKA
ncbi:MAG: sigma-70 family RNA polymerase sigma factor [Verrucomicrobiota bacterium]